ncbi:AAA family ATPase [Candidatus Bathyarchaeota archaeon]|nr:AAA family ATPase [Candidatus Bathyarchaeota archaeon]
MKIKKLKVQNFKSLCQFDMRLKDFNVLIGRNNSGKSNILDCLSFISEVTENPIDRVQAARGGYDHVVYGGNIKEAVQIEVSLDAKPKEIKYSIFFDNSKIILEQARDVSSGLVFLDRTADGTTTLCNSKGERTGHFGSGPTTSVLMQIALDPQLRQSNPVLVELLDSVREWRFYRLNPSNLRTSLDPRKQYDIGKDGKFMPLVLHTLLSSNLPIFKEIERTLKAAVPEIEELQSPLEADGTTHAAIREESFEKPFDHHQISDGTLSILANLLIAFTPSKAELIGVEEPEDYVHPKLLKFLVDVFKASGTQVLMVSHSPYLLDVVEPENILLIRKTHGKTTCKRPKAKELRKFIKELSLGELWVSGELENA